MLITKCMVSAPQPSSFTASATLSGVVCRLFMGTGRIADAHKFCFWCVLCQRKDLQAGYQSAHGSPEDLGNKGKANWEDTGKKRVSC